MNLIEINENFYKFLDFLDSCNIKENTKLSYIYDLHLFNEYLKQKNISVLDVGFHFIDTYINILKKNKNLKSVNRSIVSLRKLFKYLYLNNLIYDDFYKSIHFFKSNKIDKLYMTDVEFFKFFLSIKENTIYDIRNKIIFYIMYRTKIKISSLLDITYQDFNLIQNVFFCENRYYDIDSTLKDLLNNYFKSLKFNPHEFIFSSKKNKIINRKSIWRCFKFYLQNTDLSQEYNLNSLTHE